MSSSSYNTDSLFRVDGLVAVVTGGGSGLGRVIAHALAANGARAVYILGRREGALAETKQLCPSSAPADVIRTIVCDVTSKDALRAAADRVRSEVGYCDVLFANSGILGVDHASVMGKVSQLDVKGLQDAFWQFDMHEFTETLHVNVTSKFYTVLAFLDLLDQGNKRAAVPQKSQVILTSSIAGFARLPKAGFAYGSSKAAVTQLSKQLSALLAPHSIRVNALAPGLYPSEMTEPDMNAAGSKDIRLEGNLDKGFVPLARMGTEEEFAGTILFLVSKAGGYVDGNVLVTDGGRLTIVPATY